MPTYSPDKHIIGNGDPGLAEARQSLYDKHDSLIDALDEQHRIDAPSTLVGIHDSVQQVVAALRIETPEGVYVKDGQPGYVSVVASLGIKGDPTRRDDGAFLVELERTVINHGGFAWVDAVYTGFAGPFGSARNNWAAPALRFVGYNQFAIEFGPYPAGAGHRIVADQITAVNAVWWGWRFA
jgi:hypothetical protein